MTSKDLNSAISALDDKTVVAGDYQGDMYDIEGVFEGVDLHGQLFVFLRMNKRGQNEK